MNIYWSTVVLRRTDQFFWQSPHITSVSIHLEVQNVNGKMKHFTHVFFFNKQKDYTHMIFKLFENKYPCCSSNMILTSFLILLMLPPDLYQRDFMWGSALVLDNVIVISCILSFSFFFRRTYIFFQLIKFETLHEMKITITVSLIFYL